MLQKERWDLYLINFKKLFEKFFEKTIFSEFLISEQGSTNNIRRDKAMSKIYFCSEPEGIETDCPNCGSDAIVNDDGLVCSNPDCPNS